MAKVVGLLKHTAAAKKFYWSSAWKKCRASYIQSVFGLCERCSKPGSIVHHTEYIDHTNVDDPSITLNHENLELLCQTCHNQEHFEKGGVTRRDVMFDDDGNLIQRSEGDER